jgi:hypothetical protein
MANTIQFTQCSPQTHQLQRNIMTPGSPHDFDSNSQLTTRTVDLPERNIDASPTSNSETTPNYMDSRGNTSDRDSGDNEPAILMQDGFVLVKRWSSQDLGATNVVSTVVS